MKSIQKFNVGKILEKLDSYTGYSIFGRPLPITISTAKTPEQLVKDVKAAEAKQKKGRQFKFNLAFIQKFKNIKASDFKLSEKTIPSYILLLLLTGSVVQICAAYTGFLPWYAAPLIFGGATVYLAKMFQDLANPYGGY